MASFSGKRPVNFDKIYTPLEIIKKCNRFLAEVLIKEDAEIDQIIDPAAGPNIWIKDLLNYFEDSLQTYSLDILPDNDQVKKFDWLKLKDNQLKYSESRLIVTNPPYGYGNSGTISFINIALKHAKWVAMLVPTGTWASSKIKNFNKRWKLDIGQINQVFKGCGIFNDKVNSCNISFIVYESANDPNKKLDFSFGNIINDSDEKNYKVGIKALVSSSSSNGCFYMKVIDKFLKDDIFIGCFGPGCMFRRCNYGKYVRFLWIRFYDKDLREQYLKLDPSVLEKDHIETYGRMHQINPFSFCEIVSRYINII